MHWRQIALCFSSIVLFGAPCRAASTAQYITVSNDLAVTADGIHDQTPSGATVEFYNGATYPCFRAKLIYGETLALATGPRSPCIAPVSTIGVVPLVARYGQVCFSQGLSSTINSSYTVLTATLKSLVSPVFTTQTGELISLGTSQVIITGS